MEVPREERAMVAVNDLLAGVPTLEAIIQLYEKAELDADDEYRIDYIFSLIASQTMVTLGLIEMLKHEVRALYAIREGYRPENYELDTDDTEQSGS